jgi:Fe-S-cluster-containing hydrogenase component 2
MILNRSFYTKVSFLKNFWNSHQIKKLLGEKVFKAFNLHKTEWPDKVYFYSPRLKRIPRFTGNHEILMNWEDSKKCESICPTEAIKVTSDSFSIDYRGCIACGLCLEVAPPGLLEVSLDFSSIIK